MTKIASLPAQMLSFKSKNKAWRKKHLDWAENRTFFNHGKVRKSILHKQINYDLIDGKLHIDDLSIIVNPEKIEASYIPDNLQHYPIMNSKLNVLRGEESKRIFDFRVVCTNPTAISEIEENKKNQLMQSFQQLVENESQSEEEYQNNLTKISRYFTYEWQDMREVRANALLNHYIKELNIPFIFNRGFQDGMIVGEEIYQCDIVGGEPVIERVNPLKINIWKSGYSNRIEDADVIIMEDYWSPGRIIDTYYDVLTEKDIKYIEKLPDPTSDSNVDEMGNIDERYGFIDKHMMGEEFINQSYYFDPMNLFGNTTVDTTLPYDLEGNIRVLRMYWKSKRKIKKVRTFNMETGEEEFSFYPETYVCNKYLGEEESILWINEAWEGTKIGDGIYVNMRPRPIQYNRLSNPSKCHFGIIGSIYNLNDDKPYSLVDMMKPYNYLYDVIHDRLNRLLARNMGKLIKLDLALVPSKWSIDKWMYYAKTNGILVTDSFKEGKIGAATGKLAGAMNNNSSGYVDAELGNSIQQYMNLLEFIKLEMSEVAGISKQREGQISNRETVGGVERATLQSSHITEWLYIMHDDVKKRALECFLETAKIALKGRNKKFQYILSDNSIKVMDIDGDEFAEADYGLVVDNSESSQNLNQKLDMLAQAALQNQLLSFSTIMKLYTSCSLAEKQRMIEYDEAEKLQQAQQAQQQQQQQFEQQLQMNAQIEQSKMALQDSMNNRDNETRIIVAEINGEAEAQRFAMMDDDDGVAELEANEENKRKLLEQMREFDEKLKLDREKLNFEKQKHREDNALKEKISIRQSKNKNNNK